MFSIILLGILVALLVVLAIALLIFLDVAFAKQTGNYLASRQWQPPLVRGESLQGWATQMATTVTEKWLAMPRSKTMAIGLAEELSHSASFAISQSPDSARQWAPNCPSCRQKMIGATPPEVLAIAESMRKNLSSKTSHIVRKRATENANLVAEIQPDQYEQANITCPLWDGDASCLTYQARPLHCRGCCRKSDSCNQVDLASEHAFTVSSGTGEGLSNSLHKAGLDGEFYELNSALATALNIPNAAELWARGKPVFNQCKQVTRN